MRNPIPKGHNLYILNGKIIEVESRLVVILSLLQGIFPTQGWNPGLLHFRYSLPAEPQRKPKNTGVDRPIPFPVDLPNQGIKLGSPALQADSLPTELWGKPPDQWLLKHNAGVGRRVLLIKCNTEEFPCGYGTLLYLVFTHGIWRHRTLYTHVHAHAHSSECL